MDFKKRNSHVHKWIIPVPDAERTKRAVAKFNQQHDDVAPDLDIVEQSAASHPWNTRVVDTIYTIMRLVHLTRFVGN